MRECAVHHSCLCMEQKNKDNYVEYYHYILAIELDEN